jgi:general secretion pathway protein F
MRKFTYEALAPKHKNPNSQKTVGAGSALLSLKFLGSPTTKGDISANSERDAMDLLQKQGLTVLSLNEDFDQSNWASGTGRSEGVNGSGPAIDLGSSAQQAFAGTGLFRSRRVGAQTLAVVLYELTTLLQAGVPLASALSNLADAQTQAKPGSVLAQSLIQLHNKVRSGIMFSQALEEVDLGWPSFVLQLARAGELTGNLAVSLRSAALQMEQELAFATEARNALIYPVVLVFSGVAAALLVFVFVVPKFASILNNPKADIPAFSLAVLHAGLWMGQNKIALALASSGALILAAWAAQIAQVRQAAWDGAYNLPFVSDWVRQSELARWAAMLSVLLGHSVPILEAMSLAGNALRISTLRTKADLMRADVVGGKSLSMSMRGQGFADATSINLVAVGEKSGALAQTTQALAQLHRNASQQRLKRFLVLLEPITILLISVVLGAVMISVMLAVTSLTNVL